jgi:hypothetical protein
MRGEGYIWRLSIPLGGGVICLENWEDTLSRMVHGVI